MIVGELFQKVRIVILDFDIAPYVAHVNAKSRPKRNRTLPNKDRRVSDVFYVQLTSQLFEPS